MKLSNSEMIAQMVDCATEDFLIFGMLPGDASSAPPPSVRPLQPQEEPLRHQRWQKRLVYCPECEAEFWMTRDGQICQCGWNPLS